ncbi:MAG: hypothetical protein KAR39_12120 [Thermoplasmata archaeon]|nr:hypothetical protein [Thermoplasmata archaeon]
MSRRRRETTNPVIQHPLKGKDRGQRLATLERYGKTSTSKEAEVRAWVEILVDWEKKSEKGSTSPNRRRNRKTSMSKQRKRK